LTEEEEYDTDYVDESDGMDELAKSLLKKRRLQEKDKK